MAGQSKGIDPMITCDKRWRCTQHSPGELPQLVGSGVTVIYRSISFLLHSLPGSPCRCRLPRTVAVPNTLWSSSLFAIVQNDIIIFHYPVMLPLTFSGVQYHLTFVLGAMPNNRLRIVVQVIDTTHRSIHKMPWILLSDLTQYCLTGLWGGWLWYLRGLQQISSNCEVAVASSDIYSPGHLQRVVTWHDLAAESINLEEQCRRLSDRPQDHNRSWAVLASHQKVWACGQS